MLPGQAAEVLGELTFGDDQLLVSLLAGVSVEAVAEMAGVDVSQIVRAVPLPAVARRAGATPISPAHEGVCALFDLVGTAVGVGSEGEMAKLQVAFPHLCSPK